MSDGVLRATRLAIVTISIIFALVATGFLLASRDTPTPAALSFGSKVIEIAFPIAVLTMVALGQLIASRQPRHTVAWLFLAIGISAEALELIQGYGLYGSLVAPGTLPSPEIAVWLAEWVWAIPWSLLVLVFLVFPTGRPPTPRWWLVAWISFASTAGTIVGTLLATRPGGEFAPTFPTPGADLTNVLLVGSNTLSLLAPLLATASLVARYRRAGGDERQQLKWFAYPAGLAAVIFALSSLVYQVPDIGQLSSGVAALSVLLIPAGAAVAILRYRLYDIDVVIERTIVYGALSAAVGATYWVLVILLQTTLRPVTGGNELAVAGSTLATLALVQPLRTRIQRAVDRRFYRARYDAGRAVEAFSERLRNEVALDAVRADLLDAVHETVEPTHVSVWLRGATR
jgi:hypothetical protein